MSGKKGKTSPIRVRRHLTFFAGIAAISMTIGCANELPDLNVEEQWTEAMKRQSLYALFPITEDFMVGDIILDTRGVPGANKNDAFDVTRIARAPALHVFNALCEDRPRRIQLAGAPSSGGGASAQKATSCDDPDFALDNPDAHPTKSVILANAGVLETDGVRLNISRIPNLTVARLSQAQLDGFGSTQALGFNFGAAKSSQVGLTIKLEQLQSLQVEPTTAVELVEELIQSPYVPNPSSVLEIMSQRWPEGAQAICEGRFEDATDMKIAVVTRVEYAGKIDYEFSEGRATAVNAAVDASPLIAESRGLDPVDPTVPDQPSTTVNPTTGTAEQQLSALLTGINDSSSAGNLGGGSVSFGIGTSGNVRLQETFPRPLAVGAGARLTYPAEGALLPRYAEDVRDAVHRCARILGVDGQLTRAVGGPAAVRQKNYCDRADPAAALPGSVNTGLAQMQAFLCNQVSCVGGVCNQSKAGN